MITSLKRFAARQLFWLRERVRAKLAKPWSNSRRRRGKLWRRLLLGSPVWHALYGWLLTLDRKAMRQIRLALVQIVLPRVGYRLNVKVRDKHANHLCD
jgi:hypothetical protein